MGQGISIHVGLNYVNPDHYDGWDGKLNACEEDARDMAALASGQGFRTQMLIRQEATSTALLDRLSALADVLSDGDTLMLTYSGHGGQVRDLDGEEEDGIDETWCLWDRQVIDDELYAAYMRFRPGVRIVVLSDSCHSGTATRMAEVRGIMRMSEGDAGRFRVMPDPVARRVFAKHESMYRGVQRSVAGAHPARVAASVLLISGCQDDQLSYDGDENGLFTGTLLRVWADGRFTGSYAKLHRQVVRQMPAHQQPNLYLTGGHDPSFPDAPAFALRGSSGKEGVELSVSEPAWGERLSGIGGWVPVGPSADREVDGSTRTVRSGVPGSLDELMHSVTRSFDLSVQGAMDIGVPIAGNVSGGASRRVAILERASYREVEGPDGSKTQWGYALRYCVLVNKFDASMKLTLPFLAASAQVGSIEAQWWMHVAGLSGPKIDELISSPSELNVETFVLAKQAMDRLAGAVRSPDTRFEAVPLAKMLPESQMLNEYRRAFGRAVAIDAIAEGVSLDKVVARLADPVVADAVGMTFREFAGVRIPTDPVGPEVRMRAQQLRGRIDVKY